LARVSHRFQAALESAEWDGFVRISGDSPLIDHRLVDQAVEIFEQGHPMVTNVFPRSYPAGQSVEVLSRKFYLDELPRFSEPKDFEHVTKYFYRNAERFPIKNFNADGDHSRERLCVDTAEDLEQVRSLVRRFRKPHWQYGWKELVGMLRSEGRP
jgi:spore coat polysaccharide biosynthesis protein SpsF (cytidylyltransferase family)